MDGDVLFKGIEDLMKILDGDDEHGKTMLEIIILDDKKFYVSIRPSDEKGMLCDLQGDMFLNASGETLAQAWTDLNNICRKSVDLYRGYEHG